MDTAAWNQFEDETEERMILYTAMAQQSIRDAEEKRNPGRDLEQTAERLSACLTQQLKRAADTVIGVKKVFASTKPWVDEELRQAARQNKRARAKAQKAWRGDDEDLLELARESAKVTRRRLRSLQRKKRLQKQREDVRQIESLESGSQLYWARRKKDKRDEDTGTRDDAVLGPDGVLVTGSLHVLKVWSEAVRVQGKEPPIQMPRNDAETAGKVTGGSMHWDPPMGSIYLNRPCDALLCGQVCDCSSSYHVALQGQEDARPPIREPSSQPSGDEEVITDKVTGGSRRRDPLWEVPPRAAAHAMLCSVAKSATAPSLCRICIAPLHQNHSALM